MSSRYANLSSSCLFFLTLVSTVGGQNTDVGVLSTPSAPSDTSTKLNLESFDQVWRAVIDRAWNEDFDQQKWHAARDELRPKVEQAADVSEVRGIITDLLGRLKLSHYSVVPAEIYKEFEAVPGETSGHFESGISVRILANRPIVSNVWDGCDAYHQGMRPGWQIVSVDGRKTDVFLDGLRETLSDGGAYRVETLGAVMIESHLKAAEDRPVSVVCIDLKGDTQKLQVKLHAARGKKVSYGHVPTLYVVSEASQAKPGIGYFSFSYFFAPLEVMKSLDQAIGMSDRGLIIDLRGNIGGFGPMTMGIGSRLVKGKTKFKLGVQKMKSNELDYVLIPNARSYGGKVAILIDECSISCSEVLAGGLQSLGRARIFGSRSAGGVLPAVFHKLPNGDRFQFAIADFVDANGRRIEGVGVIPDEEVPLTKAALIAGQDKALDAAVAWIELE